MAQGGGAALGEAGLHPEKMTGTGKEACVASAATDQIWVGAADPRGSPAGAGHAGEACVMGRAAADVALAVWARDASWVMKGEGLEDQGAEPESWANVEREAFESAGRPLIG